jgi:hypothetical protein
MAGAAPVVVDQSAAPRSTAAVTVVADIAGSRCAQVAQILNAAGARPRGVPVRDAFSLDAQLIRAAGRLSLAIGEHAVDLMTILPGIGDHAQVRALAAPTVVDGATILIIQPSGRHLAAG